MYIEIGAFDAKAKLSQLLQAVKQGQRFTITLRGEPIADLVPSENSSYRNAATAVDMMRSIRKVNGVSSEMLSEWIVSCSRA